jgi:hypothetical protein
MPRHYEGESSMKRTVTLTAALMFAGMTTLGLASENMNAGNSASSMESKPAASTAPVAANPAANVEHGKQPVVAQGKSETTASKEVTTTSQKAVQSNPPAADKSEMNEKKETSSVTTTSHTKKAEHKPTAMNGKSETVTSKEGTVTSQKMVESSPAATEKPGMGENKEISSVTTTSHTKKAEQKSNEMPTTNPTK